MRWCVSHRADPGARVLADRHYNRQKVGSPQFAPTGSCAVFLTEDGKAFWITSYPKAEWVKHRWAGAWICSAFRSEKAGLASNLIREALAATRAHYGEPPELGLVTFLDPRKVEPVIVRGLPTFGYCWIKAGFHYVGKTEGDLLAFQILPSAMPEAEAPLPRSMHGTPLFNAREMEAA